ncbi:serum paraoxonase/arylesterase [Crucibulum laeve]|uniref:Serum paraoxonase/arylesterase n=1 Tax=Crucibulum laeve TaxID=68775 RepID=A0A5C3MK51_9AGAR|nr:serum paraoxonase/arylesterase [Crucibulum laeve]
MARSILNILVVVLAVAGGFYQLYLKPLLTTFGYARVIESIGNTNCKNVPELQACEKIMIHQPTGLLYLACSTPISRTFWTPAVGRLNATGASRDDFVATYDPKSSSITRLKVVGYDSPRGLSLHGMDVVPSSNPNQLFVYLVNHRAPLDGIAEKVGADSSIEVFTTTVGGNTLTHVKTVEDPVIITPNDVVGSADGKSFFFTNDHGEKTGLSRELDMLGRASTSIGYCHLDHGCKFAIRGMHGNNGIVQAPNGTLYVGNALHGGLTILEPQADNSLVLADFIKTDRGMDNLSIDSNGQIWAAAFPNALLLVFKHFSDPSIPAPSSALRFSINTGKDAFYGEKYKVEKVFEDDGSVASGITSVAYDAERKRLFMHGLTAPSLVICEL